jgi:GAF domain-containing protein
MTAPTYSELEEALAQARTASAQQATEIERLRRRLADEHFAEELREALTLAVAAGTLASPVSHARLLEMIVETAAHVISARAAALFLIDSESQELIFEVALGQKAHEVKKFRVPLGHGIAGLVAVSGQPIAIGDARSDPRQAADIAQAVGYQPQSILCVPLFYNDQVTGVLELLDKAGATGFSADDMAALGLFASQAAVAIEQSRTHRNLAALVGEVMASLAEARGELGHGLEQRARTFARSIEENADYRQALELAQLVREIIWQGEHELQACRTILRGFTEYLRSRPALGGGLGSRP